jgi:hypothetical protein
MFAAPTPWAMAWRLLPKLLFARAPLLMLGRMFCRQF